jgi:predicted O-methyltransferase YrrM
MFNIESVIYPKDPTATKERIEQYQIYYKQKANICYEFAPRTIAEIGVRAGYSSWSFMQATPHAKLYCLDANNGKHGGAYGEDGRYKEWALRILANYDVTYIDIDTQKEEDLMLPLIDFFHVDGDHTKEGVMHDLTLAKNCLSNRGVILVDDISYIPSVKEGVREWIKENKAKHEYRESLRGECIIYNDK